MISHLTVPKIAEKISRLFSVMSGKNTPEVIANDINDILIFADKIPISLLKPAWDYFAKSKGVEV